MNHIGVFGHSFGGGTSIVSSYYDNRIDACLVLDSWIKPIPNTIIEDGIDIPFMFIGQTEWTDPVNYQKLDILLENSGFNATKVLFPKATP